MLKAESSWLDLRCLEALSSQTAFIQQLHPTTKLLTTLLFLLTIASFNKYELSALLPLCLYPIGLCALGGIPPAVIAKRLVLAAPVVLMLGLFNPFFDQSVYILPGEFAISKGWISFGVIACKLLFSVSASLLLIATTGLQPLCAALRTLGCPKALVVQLLFLYRYLHLLLEESSRILLAYRMRSFQGNAIAMHAWGSLLGQWLLRSMERAERIYQAMRCRGFNGEMPANLLPSWRNLDTGYFLAWSAFFLLCRQFNLPLILGSLVTGGAP